MMSSDRNRKGVRGSVTDHGVDQRAGDVHVGQRVAEFIGLGLLQFDSPFAQDGPLVPPGPRGGQVAEDAFQEPPLEQAVGLGRQPVALRGPLQSLLFGQVFEKPLDHAGQLLEIVHIALLGVFGQGLHVDHADLRGLGRLFELLQQAIDLFEFLLDLDGFGNRHRRAAGEFIFGGQLVDLVLVAQPVDQLHELPGEGALLVVDAVPEPFDVVQLLFLDGLAEPLFQFVRRLHRLGHVVEAAGGLLLHPLGLVRFQDLPLPLAEKRHEGLQAGSQPGDLAGIEMDRPGKLLVGQLAHGAVGQHVLHGPGNQVGRRLRRTRNVCGVVALVRVDNAANMVGCGHEGAFQVISYTICPCCCEREMRSVAYSPARTNSTHDARTPASLDALTSNALSHAGGTRFKRSA